MTNDTVRRIAEWATLDEDTGASSLFFARAALGTANKNHTAIPHDAGDFGRCFRFSQVFESKGEMRIALANAAAISKHWAVIMQYWDELTGLYLDCFERVAPDGGAKCDRTLFYKRLKEIYETCK